MFTKESDPKSAVPTGCLPPESTPNVERPPLQRSLIVVVKKPCGSRQLLATHIRSSLVIGWSVPSHEPLGNREQIDVTVKPRCQLAPASPRLPRYWLDSTPTRRVTRTSCEFRTASLHCRQAHAENRLPIRPIVRKRGTWLLQRVFGWTRSFLFTRIVGTAAELDKR